MCHVRHRVWDSHRPRFVRCHPRRVEPTVHTIREVRGSSDSETRDLQKGLCNGITGVDRYTPVPE